MEDGLREMQASDLRVSAGVVGSKLQSSAGTRLPQARWRRSRRQDAHESRLAPRSGRFRTLEPGWSGHSRGTSPPASRRATSVRRGGWTPTEQPPHSFANESRSWDGRSAP